MAQDEIYDEMIQKKGLAYLDSQVKPDGQTHYREPIDHSPGRLAGNSHIAGDASPEVQSRSIDALIQASQKGGLNQHETGYVLAIARLESGFNLDAAAGTTTAYGLGQFTDGTGQGVGMNSSNRGDVTKQAESLVELYKQNAQIAKDRGQGEEYIYKYHHDGPSKDYGGLATSKEYVMPYVGKYEEFVKKYETTHAVSSPDPGFDARNKPDNSQQSKGHHHAHHAEGVLQHGDRSDAVGVLQSQLRDLGYKDSRGNPINPDNSFGNDTKSALQKFQANNGLDPDGVAGPNTLKALKEHEQALSNNRGPYADPAKAPLLNDPANPDHKLFQQAYDGVKKLDAAQGRASDQHSENLAGALTVEAKAQGLKRIDTVALSDDGSKAFAAQNVIPGAFKNVAGVETAQAVNIPMAQSTQQMTQVNQNLQQQAQVQAQTQMQNQAPQAPQGPQMGGLGR